MKKPLINDEEIKAAYSEIAENAHLPIVWVNQYGRFIHANDAACAYFGYSREELTDMSVPDVDIGAPRLEFPREADNLVQQKTIKYETRHRRKDGNEVDAEVFCHLTAVKDQMFAVCHIFKISEWKDRDRKLKKINMELEEKVTERTKDLQSKLEELQETEKKLKASEERFYTAFKTSQDAITINSFENGVYLNVNDGFTKSLLYTSEEVIGKSSLELNIWKNPEDRINIAAELQNKGFVHNYEAEFLRRDGTTVTGLMSATLINMDGKNILFAVSKDISPIKKLQNELSEMNKNLIHTVEQEVELRQKQESLLFEQRKFADMGQMINAIAHQWRQPLNALGLMVQDVSESYKLDELNDEYLNRFETDSFRLITFMSDTIDQFRNFFKTSKHCRDFNLLGTVTEVFRLIEAQLTIKNITYELICEDSKGIQIYEQIPHAVNLQCETVINGYQGEFKQALLNLIYNAADAIDDRRSTDPDIEGRISMIMKSDSEKAVISVRDNGGGIPDSIKKRIFDPYFTTKDQSKGTGIGLYMTRLIVERHFDGKISVSDSDRGAVFTMIIPLKSENRIPPSDQD